MRLFESLSPIKTSFVGRTKDRTNAVSAYLMNKAKNPWGTYGQEEVCIHCGNQVIQPVGLSLAEEFCAWLASVLNRVQSVFVSWRPTWIHMVFQKPDSANSAFQKPR
jgi:hypothetical protein